MDYFPRKSLSKYLITDTIDFNKHVHDINDKWRKYAGGYIGRLFKITRRLELCFWPTRKQSQPSQGDFFPRIALHREPWKCELILINDKAVLKKLLSLVTAAILNGGWSCRTHFAKGPTHGPYQRSLIKFGLVVSE